MNLKPLALFMFIAPSLSYGVDVTYDAGELPEITSTATNPAPTAPQASFDVSTAVADTTNIREAKIKNGEITVEGGTIPEVTVTAKNPVSSYNPIGIDVAPVVADTTNIRQAQIRGGETTVDGGGIPEITVTATNPIPSYKPIGINVAPVIADTTGLGLPKITEIATPTIGLDVPPVVADTTGINIANPKLDTNNPTALTVPTVVFNTPTIVADTSGLGIPQPQPSSTIEDTYTAQLPEIEIVANVLKPGDACRPESIPANATAGVYVANGVNPDSGITRVKCVATTCAAGAYLVVDANGTPMGTCETGAYCTTPNTKLNVIDGSKTDLACVEATTNTVVTPAPKIQVVTIQNAPTTITIPNQANCTNGLVLHNGQCVTSAQRDAAIAAANITAKTSRIQSLERELNTMANGFETTVWRNADGRFNTARLASDSIAAVVLGTTGGVVTSTVMKKKQVESGFDQIQCTIGGQVVATWGDQFTVQ